MATFKRTAFKALNAAKVTERGSRTGNKFDSIFINGVTSYRLKQGTNYFRLVRDPDSDYWAMQIWVHSYVGTKNSTYLCPKKMSKGEKAPCPICDAYEEARREGDKEEEKSLEPKERAIAYVIDREDEKAGLKVFDMSWSMDRDIANVCKNAKTGKIIDVTDPDEGFDIFVTRTGNKLNTRYIGLQVDRETTPLADSQKKQDRLIEEVQKNPLDSLLKYRDADYLADILTGKVEEKDEDADDEVDDKRTTRRGRGDEGDSETERPARSRDRGRASDDDEEDEPEARPTRRRAAPVDDDEADDAEPAPKRAPRKAVEDEDDADLTPRTARRTRAAPVEDEEADDEDPLPPRRTARRGSSKDEEDDAEDGETAEAGRWRKGEARKAKAAEPEDDEVDDAPPRRGRAKPAPVDDEDEDDEEAPPPKRAATTRKRLEDDDAPPPRRGRSAPVADDDEEEEDDEEAPPPRRVRR